MFGQPSKKERQATSADYQAQAARYDQEAREAQERAKTHRKALSNGTSTDRGADREGARIADQDAATAAYNARGLRQVAKSQR